MNVSEITSASWQPSLLGQGQLSQGVDSINQAIYIILTTIKGTDPFRPNFGCDIFGQQDKPVTQVIPQLLQAIGEALSLWEPRIVVTKISYLLEDSHITFYVNWQLKEGFDFSSAVINFGIANGSFVPIPGFKLAGKILATDDGAIIITDDNKQITLV